MNKVAAIILGLALASPASALFDEYQLQQLVGWTIVATKTVSGHITDDGEQSDDFEGCDYGMTIMFDDGNAVTCNSYGYQYAYRPTAVIFAKSMTHEGKDVTLVKILVKGQLYDVY